MNGYAHVANEKIKWLKKCVPPLADEKLEYQFGGMKLG